MYETDSLITALLERAFDHPWLTAIIISLLIGGFLYLCACEMWSKFSSADDVEDEEL